MNLFEWNESKHAINVQNFDADHKKIFNLLNDLHEKMATGKGSSLIPALLIELRDYGNKHFKDEEELMKKHSFPETITHTNEHLFFKNKIDELFARYDAGDKKLSVESFFFLKDWLIKHILETDMKYADFLHSKGIK